MSDLDTLYARWLDGELSAEEIKSLKASGEWEELEALVKATSEISVPAYDKEAAFDQLQRRNKSATDTGEVEAPRIKLSTVFSAAASLLLLVAAIYFLKETAPVATAASGETLAHELPDQSQIILNDGSSIAYEIENWTSDRTLRLEGEALFDVETGSRFVVNTDHGVVEVLGTSFNVRSWGDHFSVVCYHGKVRVKSRLDSTILTGQQAITLVNGKLGTIENITHDKPHWTLGESKFTNEKIDNVFAELERQYDISIDRPSSTQKFSGTFTHNDVDLALQKITKPMGMKYHINKERKRVIISK